MRKLTDMRAFYLYSKSRNARCSYLPVLPGCYKEGKRELRSQIGEATTEFRLFDGDFDSFHGIFDAAAIGQYLGGVDPRNEPYYGPGFINETAMYSPADLNVRWERDSQNRLVPLGSCGGTDFPIFNLHIHSKDLAAFRSDRAQ